MHTYVHSYMNFRKQIKSILKINWTDTWAKRYLMMSAMNEILWEKKSLLTVCSWSLIYSHYMQYYTLYVFQAEICLNSCHGDEPINGPSYNESTKPALGSWFQIKDPCTLVAWWLG